MDDILTNEFAAGVDAYWSGELPDGWEYSTRRALSPFLTGWYMASVLETGGVLLDRYQQPLTEE